MFGSLRVIGWLAAAVVFCTAQTAPVQAANWFEKNTGLGSLGFDGTVPACDEPFALWKIQSRFASKESRFWNSALEIVRFENIRETAWRPWGANTIPRRFCSARALTSDGRWRPVYYSIVEDGGTIGASWGVEWCVVGVDRNGAYSPGCRMARP